jgi:hypothetical protein
MEDLGVMVIIKALTSARIGGDGSRHVAVSAAQLAVAIDSWPVSGGIGHRQK